MNKGVWYRLFHCSHCKIPQNANTPTIPLSRQADRPRVEPPPPSEQKNPDEGGRQEPEMQKVARTILAEGERNAHFEQLPSKSRSRDVVYSFSEETSNGIQCPVIDRFIGDPPVQRSISDQIRNQDGDVHLFIHMGVIDPFPRGEGMPEGVPVTGEMPTVHHERHQDDSHSCTPQFGPAPIPYRADDSTEPQRGCYRRDDRIRGPLGEQGKAESEPTTNQSDARRVLEVLKGENDKGQQPECHDQLAL